MPNMIYTTLRFKPLMLESVYTIRSETVFSIAGVFDPVICKPT